jgi:glutathione S-transferase
MPKDPYARARPVLVDYALNYEPYWALRGEMLKKASERTTRHGREASTLRGLLQYLEEALGEKLFLGRDQSNGHRYIPRFQNGIHGALPSPSLPRLSAWLQRMKERPSVKAIL